MGGNAFQGVGAIAKEEIEPTLDFIFNELELPYNTSVLGSVGKKEFSGDIDIAADVPEEDREKFFFMLKRHFGEHNVQKGTVYSTFTDIKNYDPAKKTDRPRTGKVQVDFVFGSIPWLELFYHSPKNSKLKGAHRNIAISTLAGFTDREEDTYLDDMNRPIYVKRWKWSPNTGLSQVERRSRRHIGNGNWIKKQDETHVSESYYDPNSVIKILFKGKLDVSYLDSCESVIEAIRVLYDSEFKERIFKQMSIDLLHNHNVGKQSWEYPPEIAKYL